MADSEWEAALRSHGHRVTSQRLAILRSISTMKHPTAESIHEALGQAEPSLNLSTVYRNLAVLQEVGLVTHAHIDARAPVYHLAAEPSHIHLACLVCGDVTSVEPETAGAFAERVALDTDFVIQPGHSAVYGYCPNCHPSP